jgi:amino acid transporter
MRVLDLLLGRPLASDEARGEQIGSWVGIPVFGLDALSSAAYGPEAALTLLIPLGAAGIAYIVPISMSIIVLLAIVYFSYRQTIQAYPGGGGSYTVARQNLGVSAGLLPLVAAVPSVWLLLQAFASGCTAMTGVEAVSNGVKAFREPVVPTARRTLTIIIVILSALLAGIAYLVHAYGIAATNPGQRGYQSILSMLLGAVAGRGIFYYVSIVSILLVLALSANTAFADFPRLCRAIAQNNYLPHSFATRSRRLAYPYGIYLLAGLAAVLLILFRGVTDRLIPLFAVGAILAFTLSQAGMVGHWRRVGGKGSTRSVIVNGLGAMATGVTVIVVLVAKVVQGAWVTVLLIPGLLAVMAAVRRHYHRVFLETRSVAPLELSDLTPPLVIVPIKNWSHVVKKALRFALKISPHVRAIHVDCGEGTSLFHQEWCRYVDEPTRRTGVATPQLVVLPSRYRYILSPIVDYVLEVERTCPNQQVAVLIPELVERHWYHHILHNKRAAVLKGLLLVKGNQRIVVINVPWYLES